MHVALGRAGKPAEVGDVIAFLLSERGGLRHRRARECRRRNRLLSPRRRSWTSTSQPIDADNHYYEPLDAFTRHLDPKFRDAGRAGRCTTGRHTHLLIGGRVNRFIPNPTFDPIIVPGCLDLMFRGQIPEGVDPRTLMQVEPLAAPGVPGPRRRASRWPSARASARCSCSPPSAAASKRR